MGGADPDNRSTRELTVLSPLLTKIDEEFEDCECNEAFCGCLDRVSEIGPVERYESPVMMCDAVNDVLLRVPADVCVVNKS